MGIFQNYQIDFYRMLHRKGTDEFPILVDITSGERTLLSLSFFFKLALQFTKWGSEK